jgi:hypothetical protein
MKDTSNRIYDLGATAVVKGEAQGASGIVLGQLEGVLNLLLQTLGEPIEVSEVNELDPILVKVYGFLVDNVLHDAHKPLDLYLRAAPVLCGESKQGYVLNLLIGEALYGAADVLRSSAVTGEPG